jgi:hypothetical protein
MARTAYIYDNWRQYFLHDLTLCYYLFCDAIGTAATAWPIVPVSGDSEDDYGEADGM